MKIKNRFSHVWAVCLSILTFAFFNVAGQNKNLNHLTNEQRQQKGIDYCFNKADYIFEAEYFLEGNSECPTTQYKVDTHMYNAFIYYKMYITKVYRGDKDLTPGTIYFLQMSEPSDIIETPISTSKSKAIYFAVKSDYPYPHVSGIVDNPVFVNYFSYLSPSIDSSGKEIYKGFGSIYNRGIVPKIYDDVEKELFKGRKDVRIDGQRKENISNKRSNFFRLGNTTDTVGSGIRGLQLKKQYNEQMKTFYLQRDFSNLPDSTRKKIKEQIKKEFPEDVEIIKDFEQKENKNRKNKKKSSSMHLEQQAAVPNVQYAIRNRKFSDSLGLKYFYEYDVTVKTDGAGVYYDFAFLDYSFNDAVFGNEVYKNGKVRVSKGGYFSSGTYSFAQVDKTLNSTFINMGVENVGSGGTVLFNRSLLPLNNEVVLYHVKIQYNWPGACGANPNLLFTNIALTQSLSVYSNSQTSSGTLNSFGTTSFAWDSDITIPICSNPLITSIQHHSAILIDAVRGGTDDYITIKGSGFGPSKGSGKIEFKNANNGGLDAVGNPSYVDADDNDYIVDGWTDTEIKVKLPSTSKNNGAPAGTGTIRVTNSLENTVVSTQQVIVPYAIKNYRNGLDKLKINYVRQKCVNGIEFELHNSFLSLSSSELTKATAAIEKALTDWNTAIGSTYQLSLKKNGSNYVYDLSTDPFLSTDKLNIISLGNYNPSSNGAMVTNASSFSVGTSNGQQAFIYNTDISIRPNGYLLDPINGTYLNWDYNISGANISNGSYDFYGAFLHEVGHALGLMHITSPTTELMYYGTPINPTAANRWTLNSSGGNSKAGVLDILNYSSAISNWNGIASIDVGKLGSTTPPVIITASNGTSFCAGSFSTTLTPTVADATTYAWYKDGNFITGATFGTYNATAFGDYYVVIGKNGCTAQSNTLSITSNPSIAPIVNISGQAGAVCFNGSTSRTINFSLSGVPPFTVNYQEGNASMSNGSYTYTNKSFTTSATTYALSINLNNPGFVRVISQIFVTDQNCTASTTNTMAYTQFQSPTASLNGGGSYCAGGSVPTVSINFAGQSAWNVSYTENGVLKSVSTSSNPYVITPPADASYIYQLNSVSNSQCGIGVASGSSTVNRKPLPTAVVTGGMPVCLTNGAQTKPVTVQFTGTGPWSFQRGYLHCNTSNGQGCSNPTYISSTSSASSYSFNVNLNSSGYVEVYIVKDVADANCTTNSSNGTSFNIQAPPQCSGNREEVAINLTEKILIFPNPAVGEINIESPFESFAATLINAEGTELKQFFSFSATANFDIGNLANGLYILKILSETGMSVHKVDIQN